MRSSRPPFHQQRLLEVLICPECRGDALRIEESSITCAACGARAIRTAGAIDFLGSDASDGRAPDALLQVKERVKRSFPRLYRFLIAFLSPVLDAVGERRFLRAVSPADGLVLDLGSGTGRLHPSTFNVDLAPYAEVDLVARIERLPFAEGSIDGIISIAVLEHVSDPVAVVAEMLRVLRPGGLLYCFIPFMQGIHASPFDFQRYTPAGLELLFGSFTERRVRIGAGPVSGFLWLLQECVAMLLSFGSRRLYWLVYVAMFPLVGTLKYLDLLFIKHPMAANIASGFVIEARKPLPE